MARKTSKFIFAKLQRVLEITGKIIRFFPVTNLWEPSGLYVVAEIILGPYDLAENFILYYIHQHFPSLTPVFCICLKLWIQDF